MEGTRAMLTSGLVYKNSSSPAALYNESLDKANGVILGHRLFHACVKHMLVTLCRLFWSEHSHMHRWVWSQTAWQLCGKPKVIGGVAASWIYLQRSPHVTQITLPHIQQAHGQRHCWSYSPDSAGTMLHSAPGIQRQPCADATKGNREHQTHL